MEINNSEDKYKYYSTEEKLADVFLDILYDPEAFRVLMDDIKVNDTFHEKLKEIISFVKKEIILSSYASSNLDELTEFLSFGPKRDVFEQVNNLKVNFDASLFKSKKKSKFVKRIIAFFLGGLMLLNLTACKTTKNPDGTTGIEISQTNQFDINSLISNPENWPIIDEYFNDLYEKAKEIGEARSEYYSEYYSGDLEEDFVSSFVSSFTHQVSLAMADYYRYKDAYEQILNNNYFASENEMDFDIRFYHDEEGNVVIRSTDESLKYLEGMIISSYYEAIRNLEENSCLTREIMAEIAQKYRDCIVVNGVVLEPNGIVPEGSSIIDGTMYSPTK